MDGPLQDPLSIRIERLTQEEARLEQSVRELAERHAGLRDVDLTLKLARVKLSICVARIRGSDAKGAPSAGRETGAPAGAPAADTEPGAETGAAAGTEIGAEIVTETGARALTALRLLEGLLTENLSEDQKGIIQSNPLYVEAREELQRFLLAGGGGLLESRQASDRIARALSRSIVVSMRRFLREDDRYPPLDLERFAPWVRKLLLALFPVFVREHPEQPPYGIEEGQEVIYSSPAMKLPLSQAVLYLTDEVLPDLQAQLEASPGDSRVQEEIARVSERIEEYKKLRFFPRSTPVLLEKDFYTQGIASYSADGELLVPIPLSVSFRSGTNLDRTMELVRMDLVRRIAGKGISKPIDEEYRRLRSLESGIRGSSRTASMKLDPVWGYHVLKQEFPFVRRLANKEQFLKLARIVRSVDMASAQQHLAALIEEERAITGSLDALPDRKKGDPRAGTGS